MIKKILITGLVATVALIVGVWGAFLHWQTTLVAELARGATVVATDLGAVEYVHSGPGPTMAVLHGTPGGYDQVSGGPGGVPDYVPSGMALLAISRPGYLRTPIASGRTPQAQADLLAALLDELGLDSIVVVGISGGGPAALQFALRHAGRTDALVLLSARTKSHPVQSESEQDWSLLDQMRDLFGTDFLIWALGDRIAQSLAGTDSVDATTLERLRRVVSSSAVTSQREVGRANDVAVLTDPAIDAWPLENIQVPTLIVYGVDDPGVSPAESEYARERINHADLVTLRGGHFIGATHPGQVRSAIAAMLARHGVL